MGYQENFQKFDLKNNELGGLVKFAFEAAVNTAKEQSAGLAIGMDVHAITRQRAYIAAARIRLEAVNAMPWPDLPVTHPTLYTVDCSTMPETLVDPENIPVNDDTLRVFVQWSIIMRELAACNSAGLGGGMTNFDYVRTTNNIAALEQIVNVIEATPDVDFPETAFPAAQPGSADPKSSTKKAFR